MSIEIELLRLLEADGTVSAFSEIRFRTEWRDQNTSGNYVIATRVSGRRESALNGGDFWQFARVQFDCFSDSYSTVKAIAAAVTDVLHGYTGAAGAYQVGAISLANEIDLGEQEGDLATRRVALDFSITYQ